MTFELPSSPPLCHIAELIDATSFLLADSAAGQFYESVFEVVVPLVYNIRRRVGGDDLAMVDDGDLLGSAFGLFHIMRGKENRQAAFLIQLLYIRPDIISVCGSRPVVGSSRKRIAGV